MFLLCSFGLERWTIKDNRPKALLAVMAALAAEQVVSNAVAVIEEERPFKPPLFAHSRHGKHSFSSKTPIEIDRLILRIVSVSFSLFFPSVTGLFCLSGIADRVSSARLICMRSVSFGGGFSTVNLRLFIGVKMSCTNGGMALYLDFSPLLAFLGVLVSLIGEEKAVAFPLIPNRAVIV